MTSRKGIVPIIAVLLMAALSVAASGLYYAEVTKVVANPAPQDVVVTDILLSKHYGYAYFSISMMSNTPSDLVFQVSVIGEDGAIAWTIPNVLLPAKGEHVATASGSSGSDFFVGKTYIVKIEGDINMAYSVECTGVEVSSGKIFLLAINGITGDFTEGLPSSIVPQHIESATNFNAIAEETLWFAGATKSKFQSLFDLSDKCGCVTNWSYYGWLSGQPVNFNITYDSSQNTLYYTIDDKTITTMPDAGFTDLYIRGRVDGRGSMYVTVDNLEFNGETIDEMINTTNYDVLWLRGADTSGDFTLTGCVTLTWSGTGGNWGMNLDIIGGTAVEGGEYEVETSIAPIPSMQGALDTAERLGSPITLVTTLEQWDAILANPPLGAIVVNPFGGAVPASSWAVEDEASAESYIRMLSEMVRTYSWTWVHLGGYPFSSVTNGTDTVDVGNDGAEWFFDVSRINAHGRGIESLEENLLTDDDGVSLNHFLSVTGNEALPGNLWFDYGIVLPSSETPDTKFTFYMNPGGVSQAGAMSFYLGAGYYVHWGAPIYTQGHSDGSQVSDYDSASYALMVALYTVMR